MKFTLTIDSDNAECQTIDDLVDMLKKVTDRIQEEDVGYILDVNGNKVGKFALQCWRDDDYVG